LENIIKEVSVHKFARILIIHLRRFKETPRGRVKNSIPIKYPMIIKSASYAHVATGDYHLMGVICHQGEMEGGHYTCVTKDPGSKKWFNISDSSVEEVTTSGAHQDSAYILIYQSDSFD
jgi:ubiquitin C-terminal hydrolase